MGNNNISSGSDTDKETTSSLNQIINSGIRHTTKLPKEIEIDQSGFITNKETNSKQVIGPTGPLSETNSKQVMGPTGPLNKTEPIFIDDPTKKQNLCCPYGELCEYKNSTCKKIHKSKVLCPNTVVESIDDNKQNVYCLFGQRCEYKNTTCKKIHK